MLQRSLLLLSLKLAVKTRAGGMSSSCRPETIHQACRTERSQQPALPKKGEETERWQGGRHSGLVHLVGDSGAELLDQRQPLESARWRGDIRSCLF